MPASSTAKPGWSFRRKATTTAAVGILALGVWLGTMFDGFGLGSGFGLGQSGQTGIESGSEGGAVPAIDGVSAGVDDATTLRASNSGATDAAATAIETLAVLVTGDGYELSADASLDPATLGTPLSGHFAPATLEEVVARAQTTKGNASQIRVLIYRHKSSTVGLHGTLVHALQDAGIPSGGVHVVTGFFD